MSAPEVGMLRIRSTPSTGCPFAAGMDAIVEALGTDGQWLPLRGLCRATVDIAADSYITATLHVEVAEVDLHGVKFAREPFKQVESPGEITYSVAEQHQLSRSNLYLDSALYVDSADGSAEP